MGKKTSVYDEILSGYLSLRSEAMNKENSAAEKLSEAENSVKDYAAQMEAAINAGDQASYTRLYEDNVKNNAAIEFYKKLLKKYKDSTGTEADAKELYKKAEAEIVRIKTEYAEEMCKVLEPIIEQANNTVLQIELLELAKNKILLNLEHQPEKFRIQFNYTEIPMMCGLDRMLQSSDCIKEMNAGNDIALDPITNMSLIASRNNWDVPAKSRFKEEAAKWI